MATFNSSAVTEQQLAQQYQQYQLQQQYQLYQQAQAGTLVVAAAGKQDQNQLEAGGKRVNHDTPLFSRVFVVCSKSMKEEEIMTAFSAYGTVEDVWMVKDRMTKENKGICYVKYDKASSAALAIQNLDGKVIGSDPKPVKVGVVNMRPCVLPPIVVLMNRIIPLPFLL